MTVLKYTLFSVLLSLLFNFNTATEGINDAIIFEDQLTSIIHSTTGNSKIHNHKNLDLLPKECGRMLKNKIKSSEDNTLLNEFPWNAFIMVLDGIISCQGTIINSRYILTTTSCIRNNAPSEMKTLIGEFNIETEEDDDKDQNKTKYALPVQDLKVEEIILHKQYNGKTKVNDIGLIRVDRDMDFSAGNVKPVCLPIENANIFAEANGIAVELKRNEYNDKFSSKYQKTELPIVSNDECNRIFKIIRDSHLCAGGEGKISCVGGSPLLTTAFLNNETRYIQQGISSFGKVPCGSYPDVFTKVSYYMDWILDSMRP